MGEKPINASYIAQAWAHSHEEDTVTTTVYRPANFQFPPSRGRKGFHLDPSGTVTFRNPSPTDQSVTSIGTWKLSGERLELSPNGESTQILNIESVDPDRLVVQKVRPR